MSFVPAPQKANASGNAASSTTSNHAVIHSKGVLSKQEAAAAATVAATTDELAQDEDSIFKLRTFDVYWVEKESLMYKDGLAKTFNKDLKKSTISVKRKSSIPLFLRDMAPPEGSIFDPSSVWERQKELDRQKQGADADAAAKENEDRKKKGGGGGGKKQGAKKGGGISAADIKASNTAEKDTKDLQRDLQKLSNLRTLKALQDAKCETNSGKINRMIKMLHMAVSDLKIGAVGSSEAEVLDILWALEEMAVFKDSEELILQEKALKKEEKETERSSKSGKKRIGFQIQER